MAIYRVISVRPTATQGVEAVIQGPGIPRSGVPYWFDTEEEAQIFAKKLNLSYDEAKKLAASRKSRFRGRIAMATSG